MEFDFFKQSILTNEEPADSSGYLRSLWYDAKGDWNRAHDIIQSLEDKTAAWIHAYLHRKEGDLGNADYWYNRAGRKRPMVTLAQEWESIVKELLNE